ncbi:Tachykinin-like peptides receptor 99D [Araneus ventricosus]|uniref:Tachykinin-like peptides receptor 99D n=1 Tax=Araneus ventricosus TaxID=182803 RepID=A0A4Y2BIR2_ARAVE|nr:Tachykinin-like peptides receptor 99D [Araneus ventricosus]
MVPLLLPFLHGPFRELTFHAASRKWDMMDGDSCCCDGSLGKILHFTFLTEQKRLLLFIYILLEYFSSPDTARNVFKTLQLKNAMEMVLLVESLPFIPLYFMIVGDTMRFLQIVKMMIVVVVIFAVCWLPYHVYFLVAHHLPHILNETFVQPTYLIIYWLAMSNACYNPFIYCWMNSRFRQGFKSVFRCCKWKEEKINPLEQRKFTAARTNTVNGVMDLQTVTESLSGSNPLLYNKYVRHDRLSNL